MYSNSHTPVLREAIKDIITTQIPKPLVIIDATLGLGGHAKMLCDSISDGIFIGFDRDRDNLTLSEEFLYQAEPKIQKYFLHRSFADLKEGLHDIGIERLDAILYDLGVSSLHLDLGERGFSLRFDGPLDMRFDRSQGKTARDIIMTRDAKELAHIFTVYGEEKKSWFIASEIVKRRKTQSIDTTFELLEIIKASSFDPKSPQRVFQALRIATNDEFTHIEDSLHQALSLISPGGIIMVITFHSLEDRLVKQIFSRYLEDEIDDLTGQILKKSQFAKYTKKPIIPTAEEVYDNPRSRSAKLRVIQRNI